MVPYASCDTLIRNVRVLDGSGGEPYPADVAIDAGLICAVGQLSEYIARQVTEGAGRVLSPGFIDVHTHDDTSVIRNPQMLAKLSQGVTTVIVGNCGISAAPVQLAGTSRSDESAGRRGRLPLPHLRGVCRGGRCGQAGGQCGRPGRPYGSAQQPYGSPRPRRHRGGDPGHARAADRGPGPRRVGVELGPRLLVGQRRPPQEICRWPNRSPPPARSTSRTCARKPKRSSKP
jgi:hypothetical protein